MTDFSPFEKEPSKLDIFINNIKRELMDGTTDSDIVTAIDRNSGLLIKLIEIDQIYQPKSNLIRKNFTPSVGSGIEIISPLRGYHIRLFSIYCNQFTDSSIIKFITKNPATNTQEDLFFVTLGYRENQQLVFDKGFDLPLDSNIEYIYASGISGESPQTNILIYGEYLENA